MLTINTPEMDPAGKPTGRVSRISVDFAFINMVEQELDGSIIFHVGDGSRLKITNVPSQKPPSISFDEIVEKVSEAKRRKFEVTFSFDTINKVIQTMVGAAP